MALRARRDRKRRMDATLNPPHSASVPNETLVRDETPLKHGHPFVGFFVETKRDEMIDFAKIPLTPAKLNSKNGAYFRHLQLVTPPRSRNRVAKERVLEAYRDIAELDDEMKADGLPPSTAAMKDEARRIVVALAGAVPTVYGTQDGDIAIQFDSEESAVVIELSRVGGGAACFSHVGGKNRRARYDDSRDLPDDFVRSQLRELCRES